MQLQKNKSFLAVGLGESILSALKRGIDELEEQYQLEQVEAGTAALELMAKSCFQIIFIDGFLPDMTGLHLAREIKAHNRNTEVILIMPGDVHTFNGVEFAHEVDHLLKEPLSIAYIQQLVKDSMRRKPRLIQEAQEEDLYLHSFAVNTDPNNQPESMALLTDHQAMAKENSLPETTEPNLSQYDVQIHEKLLTLRHSTNSRCIMLLSSSGHVIDSVGDTNQLNITNISALIAANYMATSELAKMVGNNSFFKSTYHAGTHYDIFSHGLNDDFLLVSIFDSNSRIGLVRFGLKQATDSLLQLLEAQNQTFDFSDANIQSNVEQELDKLFAI